jgi:hypothetical protein
MAMMVMPRTQWKARANLPQLDDVFRTIFAVPSTPSDPPRAGGLPGVRGGPS